MLAIARPIFLALPLIALLAIIVLFFGIRDDPDSQKIAARMSDTHQVQLLGDQRQAVLLLPRFYDADQPFLLLLGLHGYGSNAWEYDQYLQLSTAVNNEQFAMLLPHALKDADGKRFWNATPYCCDFDQVSVDDVAHLKGLLEEAASHITIDRVAAVGHSNGAFMAHRLACEDLPNLSAIVSIAGTSFADPDDCSNPSQISLLHIHGDNDDSIRYEGEPGDAGYPGALAITARWAARAGCESESPIRLEPRDIDSSIDGAETSVDRWPTDCTDDQLIELWSIAGGDHDPGTDGELGRAIVAWLQTALPAS